MSVPGDSTFHSKRCCNPMGKEGHVGKELRTVSQKILEAYPTLSNRAKICHDCRTSIYKLNKQTSLGSKNSDSELSFENSFADTSMEREDSFEEPPNKKLCESREEQLEELLKGLKDTYDNLPKNHALRISILTILPDCWTVDKIMNEFNCLQETAEKAKQLKHSSGILAREIELEIMLTDLKKKFNSLPQNDPQRKSILTIAPDSWTIRKIVDEFECSYRMAQQSKDLKNSFGILAIPTPKKGKTLNDKTIAKVTEFYEDEANGRIMPHKKDVINVKINGIKTPKNKHLMLYDVKFLHEMFKKKYPEHPIGSTSFALLRPKWCVLAGAAGTHSVCVCTFHQNVKLMIDAVNLKDLTKDSDIQLSDYKECINFILCRNAKTDCYLLQCNKCPDMENLSNLIMQLLEHNKIEQVIFSTWQSTDRCTLKQECLPSEDFVEAFCEKLKVLVTHSFIAKQQTLFASDKKEQLKKDEVIVHCDFAENYAYVVQDAAQAFHYNNDQCSVMPVVFYYRSSDQIESHSMILLSECTTHDAAVVYLMQQKVVPVIKKFCPKVKKIYYISDGAKQHFKNRTQMMHLVNHQADFNVDAEWHCHASAHGKCACDGLGACLKSEATRYSLQAEPKNAILNAVDLYKWAAKKFKNVQFIYYSQKEYDGLLKILKKKFPNPPAVKKIQSSHAFIPVNGNELKVKRFSYAKDNVHIMEY